MRVLRHSSDVRSMAFVAATLVLLALQWSGACRNAWLFCLSCGLVFACAVINHNHQHHPTFVHRLCNRVFGVLLSWCIGTPATAIVPMHNWNHHVHNNTRDDCVRTSQVQFRWNLLNLLLFPFVALLGYRQIRSQGLRDWRVTHPRLYRQLRLERLTLYAGLAVLLVLRPLETLTYLGCPFVFGQWAIVAINLVQHDGCNPESTHDHSRNFSGRPLNWWLFNNGFHTAHHLRPGLHWSALPGFHQHIRAQIDPELERRSLALALLQFYVWPGVRPQHGNPASGDNVHTEEKTLEKTHEPCLHP